MKKKYGCNISETIYSYEMTGVSMCLLNVKKITIEIIILINT